MANFTFFQTLKDWRNHIADIQNVPGYKILTNNSLQEIADTLPETMLDLQLIKGMGPVKVRQYGNQLLDLVKKWKQGQTGENASWEQGNRVADDDVSGIAKKLHEGTLKEASGHGLEMVFRVGEYLDLVNEMLSQIRPTIEGEVGRIDRRDRYTFFTLLDDQEEAVLQCFVWEQKLFSSGVKLKEGMKLRVSGYGRTYKRRGTFSFEVTHLGLLGEGAVKQAFEQLKARLEAEGYFSSESKQPIPEYPTKIGLITSKFGDARMDFLTHLGEFGYNIYHCDVRVEGLYAVDDVVGAIRYFNESMPELDVLVITRGGGSWESLQAFNSEQMAKAIRASKIPIVTGIGHENDFTIADWCADIRCSTPTATGKLLSEKWRQAETRLNQWRLQMHKAMKSTLTTDRMQCIHWEKHLNQEISLYLGTFEKRLEQSIKSYSAGWQKIKARFETQQLLLKQAGKDVARAIKAKRMQLEMSRQRLKETGERSLDSQKKRVAYDEARLETAQPHRRLQQGYSILLKDSGELVKAAEMLHAGEHVTAALGKGRATLSVKTIEPDQSLA